ncbi:flavodoxin [Aneurinibacillus sp. REN35]|uniref:flavodoxin n=1 Tax=Aneurinibacillus sp. REN35 TaxID=3237286 RepID=UPI0035275C78
MAKVLLIYASMSGNTETIANLVEEGMQLSGMDVVKKEVFDARTDEIANYDGVVLGAYTWGDGELPDEFLDFYDDLSELDLTGKTLAVFGSGDTSYPIFCGAVDVLEALIAGQGGTLAAEGLKIEFDPSGEDIERCKSFGRQIAEAIGVKQA